MSIPGVGKARLGGPDRSQGWREIRRKARGCLVPEFTVRPLLVIFNAEVLDDDPGFGEGPELLPVEAFIAEAPVERFDKPILPWAAGLDVDGLDVVGG